MIPTGATVLLLFPCIWNMYPFRSWYNF